VRAVDPLLRAELHCAKRLRPAVADEIGLDHQRRRIVALQRERLDRLLRGLIGEALRLLGIAIDEAFTHFVAQHARFVAQAISLWVTAQRGFSRARGGGRQAQEELLDHRASGVAAQIAGPGRDGADPARPELLPAGEVREGQNGVEVRCCSIEVRCQRQRRARGCRYLLR